MENTARTITRLPWKRLGKILAILSGLLLLVLAVAVVSLDSKIGQKFLVTTLNNAYQDKADKIFIGSIEGSLYTDFSLKDVTVSDANGPWLSLHNLHINWQAYKIFWRHIDITDLSVETFLLHRKPHRQKAPPQQNDAFVLTLPSLPVDIEIERLAIAKLRLEKALLGRAAEFTSQGRLSLTQKDGILIRGSLINSGKSKDEMNINISYPGEGGNLTAHIDVKAPKGGIFTKLLSIDPNQNIDATLEGDGPLQNWSGTFIAHIGPTTIADATLQMIENRLSVRAKLDAGDFIDETSSALFGRSADLSLDFQPDANLNRTAIDLKLKAETLNFTANGSLPHHEDDSSQAVIFSLELTDPRPLNKMFSPLEVNPFELKGSLTKFLQTPTLKAEVENLKVGYGPIGKARFKTKLALFLKAKQVDFTASGQTDSITLNKNSDIGPLLTPGLAWSVNGNILKETSQLTFDHLSLANDLIKLEANGKYAPQTGALSLTSSSSLPNIAKLRPPLAGKMLMKATVTQPSKSDSLMAALDISAADFNIGSAIPQSLIGRTPTFTAHIERSPIGTLVFDDVILTTPHLSLKAKSRISPQQIIEQGDISLAFSNLEDIKNLEELEGLGLTGGIDILGKISGSVAQPDLLLTTHMTQLTVQDFVQQDVNIELMARNILSAPNGNLSLHSQSNYGALSGQVDFLTLPSAIYSLPNATLSLGPYQGVGAFQITPGKPVTGNFIISTQENTPTTTPLQGNIEAALLFQDKDGIQQVELDSKFTALTLKTGENDVLALKSGQLSASTLIKKDQPDITLKGEFQELSHPRLQARSGEINLQTEDKNLKFTAHMQGTDLIPYDLTAHGRIFPSTPTGQKITLGLDGTIDQKIVHLKDPVLLTLLPDGFALDAFELQLDTGHIMGQLKATQQEIQTQLTAQDANLNPLLIFLPEMPLSGHLTGNMTLAARPQIIEGGFSFGLSQLQLQNDALSLDKGLIISSEGTFTPQALTVTAHSQLKDTLTAHMAATLPIQVNNTAPGISFSMSAPLQGNINIQGDISPIWPALNLVNHDLSAEIDTRLTLSGSLENPDIDGHFHLTKGHYETLQMGFVASNIDVAATIADRHIILDHFTANDGADGEISAQATGTIHRDLTYDLQATLDIVKARLVRLPNLNITASTNLMFEKNATAGLFKGDVTVDHADIGAISSGSSILELEVEEINLPEHLQRAQQQPSAAHFGPFPLDLKLMVPGKMFIRSYGLDSEWRADLALTGTTDKPVVTGPATLVRGKFDFSGKSFTLTSGHLDFPADNSNDPFINISAEHTLKDLTALLHITGRASAPILAVSSTPSLPQDEILSRILFGTSVTKLSALEAIQLAATVHSLSKGGGPGFIGGVRNALGFDRLSIDKSENRAFGTIITGGKYLTQNVYIEVTAAPATGETSTSVEVTLTRGLSLITQKTMDSGKNLALRWSWRY